MRPAHRLLLGLALGALVAAVLPVSDPSALAAGTTPATPASRPNILLITTDDQSAADMAYMPRTRRLLGDRGVRFTDAISSYPLCCPARASILTGELAHNHGVRTNGEPTGGYSRLATQPELNDHTIGTWLRPQYLTMFAGKYLNGYGPRDEVPPGWDSWNATIRGTYDYYDFSLKQEDGETAYGSDPLDYQTYALRDVTEEHIDQAQAQNKPFFIWQSNLAPHDACQKRPGRPCAWQPARPAPDEGKRYQHLGLQAAKDPSFNERVVSEKPANVRALPRWGKFRRDRALRKHRARVRSLLAVDRSVAQTVGHLREIGELDNTLIIFTSDNGYMLGQHRWQGKILPYEPSLKVPLLMSWPGHIPEGVVRRQTAALVDIPRTIADAAGVTPGLPADGRSLLPIARGEPGANGYGAMSIESGQQGWDVTDPRWFYHGVRTKRYTFLRYPRTHEVELYDRRKDPYEMTSVAHRPAYARTRAVLQRKLDALRACKADECLGVGGRAPAPRAEPYLTRERTVHPDDLGSIGRARQVVTITTHQWHAGRAMLTAWQRRGKTWRVRRGPFAVELGPNGFARAAQRRDGTGTTPAGTFEPAFALGRLADPGTDLRYRRFDRNDYWATDPRDPRTYNVYQRSHSAHANWRPQVSERWWTHRARYPYALMLDFNLPARTTFSQTARQEQAVTPADVHGGSLLLQAGSQADGRGWTSLPRRQLRWLLRWMRPQASPVRFVTGPVGYLRNHL